jgi:hypothetical protein
VSPIAIFLLGLVIGVVIVSGATWGLTEARRRGQVTALHTSDEKLDFDQGVANALAKAVASAQARVVWKGRGVFLSMLALAMTDLERDNPLPTSSDARGEDAG